MGGKQKRLITKGDKKRKQITKGAKDGKTKGGVKEKRKTNVSGR